MSDAAFDGCASEVSSLLRNNPDYNWTLLHVASYRGRVEVVKLLLAHLAIDVNVKNDEGQTPLSFGCEKGRVSVVRVRLKDPRVDVTLDDPGDALHCGTHRIEDIKRDLSGSLQVVETWET